jgi:hypothetical protein
MSLHTDALAICADKESWWATLKDFNRGTEKTGRMIDQMTASSNDIDRRVEEVRRTYFPRAHALIIQNGEAITVSKTGRSIRQVWTANRE